MASLPPEHDLRPCWVRTVDAVGIVTTPAVKGIAFAFALVFYVALALGGALLVALVGTVTVLRLVPEAWFWKSTEVLFCVSFVALLASPKVTGRMMR